MRQAERQQHLRGGGERVSWVHVTASQTVVDKRRGPVVGWGVQTKRGCLGDGAGGCGYRAGGGVITVRDEPGVERVSCK